MCYEASMARKVKKLEDHYGVERSQRFEIGDNDFLAYHLRGAQHPEMLVIPQESTKELHPMVWGIIPDYIPGHKQNDYYTNSENHMYTLNAQSEKLFTYDLYHDNIMHHRCIIPLTGFFEPHRFMNTSYPFLFTKNDHSFFSVAGIYSESKDGMFRSFTMLTRKASDFFHTIHNNKEREIILFDDELAREWLRPDLNEKGISEIIKVPYNESTISVKPVSRDIYKNSVDSNNSEILNQVDYPELALDPDLEGIL